MHSLGALTNCFERNVLHYGVTIIKEKHLPVDQKTSIFLLFFPQIIFLLFSPLFILFPLLNHIFAHIIKSNHLELEELLEVTSSLPTEFAELFFSLSLNKLCSIQSEKDCVQVCK